MKLSSLLLGSFLAVASTGEVFAQRSPSRGGGSSSPSRSGGSYSGGSSSRGPSYNPSRGSSSSSPSRSSGSSTRGPSYNPSRGSSSSTPSRSTTSTRPSRPSGSSVGGSNSGSSTRGPSYNPGRGSSSTPRSTTTTPRSTTTPRGPSYNPTRGSSSTPRSTTTTPRSSNGTVRGTTTPRGPNYNPTRNAPNGPRYGSPSTRGRVVIRGPRYNPAPSTARPYRPIVYRNYRRHIPYAHPYYHTIRYVRPYDYYFAARRYHIYRYWLFEPVAYSYNNGYYVFNEYPYYVYNGYRHRYSTVDLCSYQLVDSTDNSVVKSFTERVCQAAYDECSLERDVANQNLSESRYFCAERVDDSLANVSDDSVVFDPQPTEQTDSVWSAINNYLSDRSYKQIWKDGYKRERFDPKCSVEKVRGNKHGCKYVVKVAGKNYPDHEGEICSESDSAALAGCDVGNEKKNAGCLLKLAISEGLCH